MKALISTFTVLAAALMLGALALAPAQDAATDEEAIDALGASFKKAWNGRDAEALGQTYTEDADEINEPGQRCQSRIGSSGQPTHERLGASETLHRGSAAKRTND